MSYGISQWLSNVSGSERPRTQIVAFNVGLFESPDGFVAYLIGSSAYDPVDDDWAC